MSDNNAINNYTFYNNVTSINDNSKSIFMVSSNASEMNLNFECSEGGTFSAKIYAAIINKENMKPYPCYKLPDYTLIKDVIIDDGYLYNIDLTSIDYLKVELISLIGSISVFAKAVG